jgi:protein-S-isoprenylcysteine O-methyltransferase Ste14
MPFLCETDILKEKIRAWRQPSGNKKHHGLMTFLGGCFFFGAVPVTRNPMLSGVFLALFGIGFLCRSLSLITVYAPLFIVIAFFEFRTIEEPQLEKRLGAPYVEYRKKVSMFFPYPGYRRKDQ